MLILRGAKVQKNPNPAKCLMEFIHLLIFILYFIRKIIYDMIQIYFTRFNKFNVYEKF